MIYHKLTCICFAVYFLFFFFSSKQKKYRFPMFDRSNFSKQKKNLNQSSVGNNTKLLNIFTALVVRKTQTDSFFVGFCFVSVFLVSLSVRHRHLTSYLFTCLHVNKTGRKRGTCPLCSSFVF